MSETFVVERESNDFVSPRTVLHEGPSYFEALNEYRAWAVQDPRHLYLLSVSTHNRCRHLEASDQDNVVRIAHGLIPLTYTEMAS